MLKWKITRCSESCSGLPVWAGATRSRETPLGSTSCASTRPSRKARCARRALCEPDRRHICAGTASQRRLLDPAADRPELGITAENTFIYIRGYPSKAERDKRLKAAHDDPEFAEVVTKQERDPEQG